MYEIETLKCQNYILSYPYILQDMWPNKNNLGDQFFHHSQMSLEIKICDGFAIDYHVTLFFEQEKMVIPIK